jgi:hypothetical protein
MNSKIIVLALVFIYGLSSAFGAMLYHEDFEQVMPQGVYPWASDTVHYSVDGTVIDTSWLNTIALPRNFGWIVKTINIPSTGVHTIDYWVREDGAMLYKMILTTSSSYNPSQNIEPAENNFENNKLDGDHNGDGVVNLTNLSIVAGNWLK